MILAGILPLYGKWIDAQLYPPIFITMSLLPLFGTLIFLWLSAPWAGKGAPAANTAEGLSAQQGIV